MKKISILLILIMSITNNFAQQVNNGCLDIGNTESLGFKRAQLNNPNKVLVTNDEKFVYNVHFTVYNDDQGHNYYNNYYGNNIPFGEPDFLDAIKELNVNFNQFNIYFKYYGYEFKNNSSLTNIEDNPVNEYFSKTDAIANELTTEAINIVFVNHISTPVNASATNTGAPYSAAAILGRPLILIDMAAYNGVPYYPNGAAYDRFFLICHEMGHVFNLNHTYLYWNSPNNSVDYPGEHVTRDVTITQQDDNDHYYNADFAGDMVEDTVPERNDYVPFQFVQSTCSLNPSSQYTDCAGTPLDYPNTHYGNFMGIGDNLDVYGLPPYFNTYLCNKFFTAGQGAYMRNYSQNLLPFYSNTGTGATTLDTTTNTIESLYQPFIITGGGSNAGDPVYSKTITPNQMETGVNVWNCGPFKFRFQPGFECEFSSLPNSISQTVNDQFNGVCNGYFMGVKIPILGPEIKYVNAPLCFGSFEPFTHGDIKTTPNLGLPYYTLEQLDEIKASDPRLFEKLQSMKYHVITKQTDNGYIFQKVIYKN